MIEIRTNCENCDRVLPPDSEEAMICAFECTYCIDCVDSILHNVCPNCGGGFERRPVLRKKYLAKYPPSDKHILHPVDHDKFQHLLHKLKDVNPSKR